ncbi:SRPBCC family protein [Motilibacter deserti]|uniref:SRPBCC domain-containing protein n=1 Tax=Motilibacter deserti TaxID=2714956 RepID=A0ABX0GR69_9ACTN|nr:SRPBCC domain-containing protein [Motilibacter deserti]NHC12215.1 SRPBCC domain-containing protein [Motilibacter deserti]
MTVVSTTPDAAARTFTIVAELASPPSAVWQLWVDPRRLERWWGPPTWPATFTKHQPEPGGESRYYMTGPEGEKAHGWWRFVALDEPSSLEFEDGFGDAEGNPDAGMPTVTVRVALEEAAGGTRMTITSHFATDEQMHQLVEMGMAEGMSSAVEQMDGLLAPV